MQNENDELTQKLAELQDQYDALQVQAESQAAEASNQLSELTMQYENLQTEKAGLETEKTNLTESLAAAEQKAADAIEVSELLQKAITANEEGHFKTLKKILDQIEPLKDLLSPSEMDYYESLIMD